MFLNWRHIRWSKADGGAVFGLLSLIWGLSLEKRVSSARPLSVQDHQHPGPLGVSANPSQRPTHPQLPGLGPCSSVGLGDKSLALPGAPDPSKDHSW